MGISRIADTFVANKQAGRKSLIVYISAGDPSLKATASLVKQLSAAGADIIELGVPFSDPVADGPVIQAASYRALAAGASLSKIIQMASALRKETQIPMVLMSYYNPLLRYGLANLAADMDKAGVDGLIVPDLPWEESQPLREALARYQLAGIPLIAPNTPVPRLIRIAASASGFIYCVSLTGVTGIRQNITTGIQEYMERVRAVSDLPIGVGFGIGSPEQASSMAPFCDGIIVGSAVVHTLYEEGEAAVIKLVKRLKQAI
ncbi:MAG: tryptophan synthase subunit alpha [Syntrophomonadaceae bacterium]|jgi:tryptophan synthase alpha chain|nr:tryptophan synthase subunit alpha [Syntrophomonadaceae bacterium]